jgi:hypothetical protein
VSTAEPALEEALELEPWTCGRSAEAAPASGSALVSAVSVAWFAPEHPAVHMHAATDIDAVIAVHCPREFTRVLFMRDLSTCWWCFEKSPS